VNHDEATAFARQWVKDWNNHDIEAVLSHFADDVTFTSPLAARLFPDSEGVITGIGQLREYWSEGIRRNPALRFDLDAVYTGVDTIVIAYRNEQGTSRCEVLTFREGLVQTGHGTYGAE